MLDFVVIAAALITIMTYSWSIKAHFKSTRMPEGAWLISVLVIASGLVLGALVYVLEQPTVTQYCGLVIMIAAYCLFWRTIAETRAVALLAAFDEKLPASLVMSGPYRLVRHPFYSSYILFWAGFAVAAWSIWAIIPFIGMTVTYWRAARDEEAKFSKTPMAETYARYVSETARFIPGII